MNYTTLTEELSKSTGIKQDIFDIDLDNERLVYEDHSLKKYAPHKGNSYYVAEYEYKENPIEQWECVTLYINKHKVDEFVKALNPILVNHDHDKIDLTNIPGKFEYQDEGLLYLIGFNNDTHLQIDIARTKT